MPRSDRQDEHCVISRLLPLPLVVLSLPQPSSRTRNTAAAAAAAADAAAADADAACRTCILHDGCCKRLSVGSRLGAELLRDRGEAEMSGAGGDIKANTWAHTPFQGSGNSWVVEVRFGCAEERCNWGLEKMG